MLRLQAPYWISQKGSRYWPKYEAGGEEPLLSLGRPLKTEPERLVNALLMMQTHILNCQDFRRQPGFLQER
jgi:hypothetical protein